MTCRGATPMTRLLVLAAALGLALAADPLLAAPGGTIAKAVFETFWGRVALAGLVIFFLPLIVHTLLRERRATRRAARDLDVLAAHVPAFGWLELREQALDCFERVHAAWRGEDMDRAAECMTEWYRQNQQRTVLERWRAEGLVNHCEVKKVSRVRPMLVEPRVDAPGFAGSKVVLAIGADMQDYLARRDSGEIVEGSDKVKRVESLWTFELRDGRWKVSRIDDGETLDEIVGHALKRPRAADRLDKQRQPGPG